MNNLSQSAQQSRLSDSAFKIKLRRRKYMGKALAAVIALKTLSNLGHQETQNEKWVSFILLKELKKCE